MGDSLSSKILVYSSRSAFNCTALIRNITTKVQVRSHTLTYSNNRAHQITVQQQQLRAVRSKRSLSSCGKSEEDEEVFQVLIIFTIRTSSEEIWWREVREAKERGGREASPYLDCPRSQMSRRRTSSNWISVYFPTTGTRKSLPFLRHKEPSE